jgi:hypothetical protein
VNSAHSQQQRETEVQKQREKKGVRRSQSLLSRVVF